MTLRFLLTFFLLYALGYSQTKLDSLKLVLDQAQMDSVKIKTLHQLFNEHQKESISLAESTLLEAIALSERQDESKLLAIGYDLYGSFLRLQSRVDEAIAHLTKSLETARNNGFLQQQSDALVCLGHNYWQKGDFDRAAEYQRQNIRLFRQMADSMRVGNSYIGLGSILAQQGEYTKAMNYYTMASERFRESDDLRGYRVAISNIGYIQRSLENYDSAIDYYKKSDSISHMLEDITGKASANYNLSIRKQRDVLYLKRT